MKRILMAMLAAVMLAVAIPLAPVQVQEAEAHGGKSLQCEKADSNADGIVNMTDVTAAASEAAGEDRDEIFDLAVRCFGQSYDVGNSGSGNGGKD